MALVRRLAKLDVGDPVVELKWTKVDPNSNLIRLIKTSTSTPGPHLNCKNQPSDFLASEPMTINIQNRQHIRPFSPFNSVRAAFLKSCLCFLCPHGACVCCYPNLHSFSVFATFSLFLSRPFLIILTHLMGTEAPPFPRPIPSPGPNLIKSQQKCFAKFTNEFKQNRTTTQST